MLWGLKILPALARRKEGRRDAAATTVGSSPPSGATGETRPACHAGGGGGCFCLVGEKEGGEEDRPGRGGAGQGRYPVSPAWE